CRPYDYAPRLEYEVADRTTFCLTPSEGLFEAINRHTYLAARTITGAALVAEVPPPVFGVRSPTCMTSIIRLLCLSCLDTRGPRDPRPNCFLRVLGLSCHTPCQTCCALSQESAG